jgi:hypothetical protein
MHQGAWRPGLWGNTSPASSRNWAANLEQQAICERGHMDSWVLEKLSHVWKLLKERKTKKKHTLLLQTPSEMVLVMVLVFVFGVWTPVFRTIWSIRATCHNFATWWISGRWWRTNQDLQQTQDFGLVGNPQTAINMQASGQDDAQFVWDTMMFSGWLLYSHIVLGNSHEIQLNPSICH